MIIWIASYPRSGNTLFRLILRNVFDISTYSKHGDAYLKGPIAGLVGHLGWPGNSFEESYEQMCTSSGQLFVKTHDVPDDDGKSVYIVRDGRATISSYYHYTRALFPDATRSLRDVITGFATYGSWGAHLTSWNPMDRPHTLLVRYEDMLENPETVIERISAFCEIKPLHPWKNIFPELHEKYPHFFRRGLAEVSEGDFSPQDLRLFWWLHGDWMQKLGYCTNEQVAAMSGHGEIAADMRQWLASKSAELNKALYDKEMVIQGLVRKKHRTG